MRPPLQPPLRLTQLFGGNPAREAYSAAGGIVVVGHTGIDLDAPIGTDCYACWPGIVEIVDSGIHGFGLHVVLTDPSGRVALYGHLSKVLVTTGTSIPLHTPFALTGSTGFSTGPHLHFEVRQPNQSRRNGYNGAHDPLGNFDDDVTYDLSLTNL